MRAESPLEPRPQSDRTLGKQRPLEPSGPARSREQSSSDVTTKTPGDGQGVFQGVSHLSRDCLPRILQDNHSLAAAAPSIKCNKLGTVVAVFIVLFLVVFSKLRALVGACIC